MWDMYYLDGQNPPIKILIKVLEVCEQTTWCHQVHCKAGLGRTEHASAPHEAPQVHRCGNYCVVPHLPARFRHRSPATFYAGDGARVVARSSLQAASLDGEKKALSFDSESVASLGSSMAAGLALAGARSCRLPATPTVLLSSARRANAPFTLSTRVARPRICIASSSFFTPRAPLPRSLPPCAGCCAAPCSTAPFRSESRL